MASIGYLDPDSVSDPILDRLRLTPLSNLHWKPDNLPLKSINQLYLEFVKDLTIASSHSRQTTNIIKQNDQYYHNLILQSNNNKLPYIQLFFVEDNKSVDEYRSKTRPVIRKWLEENGVDNKLIEVKWLIILVAPQKGDSHAKSSLFNKIKTDFNSELESHCVKLNQYYAEDLSQQLNQDWGVLLTLLKEKILASFTQRLSLYNSQLALLDERTVVNPYFKVILKNHIMKVYHDMTLSEESMKICDQIIAEFRDMRKKGLLELPLQLSQLDLTKFSDNKSFELDLDFDKLILERKMDTFQFFCYHFLHLATCLLELASSDSSLSFSTMHIVELLTRVKSFCSIISELSANLDTATQAKLNEFQYLMIDEFLDEESVKSNVSLNLNNPEVGRIADVMEFVGELKMTQRAQLVFLGGLLNYRIKGIMYDISLDDEQAENGTDPLSIDILSYQPLKTALQEEDQFQSKYIEITKAVIEDFNTAQIRPRTIDNLSTELLLISYHSKQYNETKIILQDSFRYYEEQGWGNISSYLLRIYISCLENIESVENVELLGSYLDLISSKSCSDNETLEISDKIAKISSSDSTTLQYPASRLFDFKVVGDSWKCCDVNKYGIDLVLKNDTKVKFSINRMDLKLVDKSGRPVEFHIKDTEIEKGENTFQLQTNTCYDEEFAIESLSIFSSGLNFVVDLQPFNFTVIPFLSFDNGIKNFSTELAIPRHRNLNEKSILLTLVGGSLELEGIRVGIKCITPDLAFEIIEKDITAETHDGEAIPLLYAKEELQLKNPLKPLQTVNIRLPYMSRNSLKATETRFMDFKYQISYSQKGEDYKYYNSASLDASLSISVTVQDIFKASALFTNFSIGSSDSKNPIRIVDVNLQEQSESSPHYSIEAPQPLPRDIVAFGGQPVKSFYKIEKVEQETENSNLLLHIEYRELKEECLKLLQRELKAFMKDEDSSFEKMWSILQKKLIFKLPLYAVSRLIKVEEFDIDKVPGTAKERQIAEKFMAQFWAPEGRKVEPVEQDLFKELSRSLEISVPMPLIQYIHEVEFLFDRAPNYIVGNSVEARLSLKSTTSWSGEPPLSTVIRPDPVSLSVLLPPTPLVSRPTSPGLETTSSFLNGGDGKYWESRDTSDTSTSSSTIDLNLLELRAKKKKKLVSFELKTDGKVLFQVELQASDDWLISGHKKFVFDLQPNGTHEFEIEPRDVVLIPLKVGRIPLPKIDIRLIRNGEVSADTSSIEVDYKNSSETVVVVSESDRISFEF